MQMDIVTLAFYIVDLFAPALVVALVVSFINLNDSSMAPVFGLRARLIANSLVGSLVLAGGLVYFGEDGKMATYAVLVLGVATSQWLFTKGRSHED